MKKSLKPLDYNMPIDIEKYKITPQEVKKRLDISKYKLAGTQPTTDQELIRKGEEAKKYMELPWYKKPFTKEFAAELPGAVAKVAYEQPAKFAISAAELPETIIKGRATERTYDLPGLDMFQSFQTEAQERAGKIRAGELPLWTALIPFAEVPLAGMEFGGLLSGTKKVTQRSLGLLRAKITSKADDALIDLTQPLLKKKTSIQALERTGMPGGAKLKGVRGKIKVQPSQYDEAVAQSVKGIVNPKSSSIKNLNKVNDAISTISEKQVKPFLQQSPRPFNVATLESKLRAIEPPDIIKSDATLKNTYNLIRDRMIGTVKKSKKTMDGLWDARKEFDNIIGDQFGDIIYSSEKNTAVKRGVLDMRRAVNDFIGDSIGNSQFKDYMSQLSNMYVARHNIAEKSYKLFETTGIQRFFQTHPLLKKGVKYGGYGAAGVVGGTVATKLFK